MYKSHVATGLASLSILSVLQISQINVITICLAIFFSILPDIDHPKSVIGRYLPFISYPLDKLAGHRTLTHSVLSLAIVSISLLILPLEYSSVIVVAFASHLILDYFTLQGIQLFFPKPKFYKLGLCKSGGKADYLIVLPISIITIFIPFLLDAKQMIEMLLLIIFASYIFSIFSYYKHISYR